MALIRYRQLPLPMVVDMLRDILIKTPLHLQVILAATSNAPGKALRQ
jgi:hypothetical protein